MMNEKMKKWSLLDPKPVLYFDHRSLSWLAVWNGIFMTAEHALILTSECLWKNPPTKEMTKCANEKMKQLYCLGVYDDVIPKDTNWSNILESGVLTYYNKVLPKHIHHHFSHLTEYESWLWFEKMLRNQIK